MEQAWNLIDLDYAEDVTFLEPESGMGQQTLYSLQRAGEEVGLTISKSKTKLLGLGEAVSIIHLDGFVILSLDPYRL